MTATRRIAARYFTEGAEPQRDTDYDTIAEARYALGRIQTNAGQHGDGGGKVEEIIAAIQTLNEVCCGYWDSDRNKDCREQGSGRPANPAAGGI
jgi:hypothetical protein